MQVNNQNQNIHFQGATRMLKRHHYKTAQEIYEDVFVKHPKADGIAGSLPHSWIKNILHLPKEEKGEIIKHIYRLFRETFSEQNPQHWSKKNLEDISKSFTNVLREYNIIPPENQVVIKRRKVDGCVITGGFSIKERGADKTLEPLFVKQFKDNFGRKVANTDGIFAELALGMHFKRLFNSEHILSPYFGDTKARFMVSRYETTPQGVKIPRPLTLEEAFNHSVAREYIEKLKATANDETDIPRLLARRGFFPVDMHDENIILTTNPKGKLITKLIDLGKIVKSN